MKQQLLQRLDALEKSFLKFDSRLDAEFEKTLRRNGKWAKITRREGKWAVAQGWEGQFSAKRVLLYPTKDGAMISADNWLDD